MIKSVFEGRESVRLTYDNILIYLNSILTKDSADELQVDLNNLEDLLIVNEGDDYSVFKINFFKMLDKYLILFGIVLRNEKSFDVYFKIFYLLYSLNQLDYYKEEVEIITYGDYNEEDKLHLLFNLYFEETIEVLDTIDVSPLFFTILENSIKEEKVYNIELIQRAVLFSKYDEKFKYVNLFKDIMTGDTIFNMSIKNDLELIKNELTDRVYKNIIDKYEYKTELEKVSDEIVFTLLFYHYDSIIDLTKVLDRDYILSLFNKPIMEIDNIILNINTRISNILRGENNE